MDSENTKDISCTAHSWNWERHFVKSFLCGVEIPYLKIAYAYQVPDFDTNYYYYYYIIIAGGGTRSSSSSSSSRSRSNVTISIISLLNSDRTPLCFLEFLQTESLMYTEL